MNQKQEQETRGVDTQYAAPLATASTNEVIRALHSDIHHWLTETDDCDGIAYLIRLEERLKAILASSCSDLLDPQGIRVSREQR